MKTRAKEYLEQIRRMDEKINADIEEIACLEALAEKTTSVLGGERVQASGSQQKMADCVGKMVDMQKSLEEEIDKYIDYKKEARELIRNACDIDCMTLLQKRYFGSYDETKRKTIYKTWERIAVEMNFTYQWVSGGLHRRALAQVQKALNERMDNR